MQKEHEKADDGQAYAILVQVIEGDVKRLSQLEGDCLRLTHDSAPRHYSRDAPTRYEQCVGVITGRK